MQTLKSSSIFSKSHFLKFSFKPKSYTIPFLYDCSYYFSSSTSVSKPPLFDYLVRNLDFTETLALSISNRYSHVKYFKKAQSVANFLQILGFSNAQIASSVRIAPQIMVADVENKLKPKIKFFQDLGLEEPHLGKFFSKNSALLTCSLQKLVPSIQLVKNVLGDNNEDMFKVLNRCSGFIARDGILKLSRNIEYLQSCGIDGSQLSKLLTRQPRVFRMTEPGLKDLVSRALEMGVSTDSRMFVHAIHTLNCLSEKTFKKKWELFKSFGLTDDECACMFRNGPGVFRVSEEKLKLGFEFYVYVAKFDKNVLVSRPYLLMSSMEDRVIPRYRVLQIIKSKKLMKTDLRFLYVLDFTVDEFLKFMSRFPDDLEELLMAFKAPQLYTTSSLEEDE